MSIELILVYGLIGVVLGSAIGVIIFFFQEGKKLFRSTNGFRSLFRAPDISHTDDNQESEPDTLTELIYEAAKEAGLCIQCSNPMSKECCSYGYGQWLKKYRGFSNPPKPRLGATRVNSSDWIDGGAIDPAMPEEIIGGSQNDAFLDLISFTLHQIQSSDTDPPKLNLG